MKLKYKGSLRSGNLRMGDGSSFFVVRGESYDVTEKQAKDLLKSGLFVNVTSVNETPKVVKVDKKNIEDTKNNDGGDKKW